jgi:hypothetical protein
MQATIVPHLNNGLVALVPMYLDGSDKLGDEAMVLILNQAPGMSLSIIAVGIQPEGRFERIGVVTEPRRDRACVFGTAMANTSTVWLWGRVIVIDGWMVQRCERSRWVGPGASLLGPPFCPSVRFGRFFRRFHDSGISGDADFPTLDRICAIVSEDSKPPMTGSCD